MIKGTIGIPPQWIDVPRAHNRYIRSWLNVGFDLAEHILDIQVSEMFSQLNKSMLPNLCQCFIFDNHFEK